MYLLHVEFSFGKGLSREPLHGRIYFDCSIVMAKD